MVEQRQIDRSKQIHRETGKTFYVATRFLPERVRHPTYVLYAFFRVADEVVDGDNDLSPAKRTERLEAFRRAALGEEPTDDPVLSAFAEIRERHGIPTADVNTFVDAMATDVEKARYETYDELRTYMDGSAAAVGRMMTAVMSPERAEAALPAATALGEAFQLTNFVRDVHEDIVDRDRIYLPLETLEAYGADPGDVEARRFTAELEAPGAVPDQGSGEPRRDGPLDREPSVAVLRALVERAEPEFVGAVGLPHVSASGRACQGPPPSIGRRSSRGR